MTSFPRPWPYAAKVIVQHEFDTDHLNVWLTFRFAMDVTVKPPVALWNLDVDGIDTNVIASAWQDSWTLLLTSDAVGGPPDRLLLEYDGPHVDLRITWQKQWEPFGPILSTGPTILPYGNFFGNELTFAQAAAENVWYTINDVAMVEGCTYLVTFQNDQELLILQAGVYMVDYHLSVECSLANKHVLAAPEIDGIEQPCGQTHIEFGRANEEHSWSGTGFVNVAVDDKVSLGIACSDAGNPTLTLTHMGLRIIKVFGT